MITISTKRRGRPIGYKSSPETIAKQKASFAATMLAKKEEALYIANVLAAEEAEGT